MIIFRSSAHSPLYESQAQLETKRHILLTRQGAANGSNYVQTGPHTETICLQYDGSKPTTIWRIGVREV